MKLRNLTILCFSFLLLIVFGINALGCSCAAKPSVLESFENSELVVIAKVVSVEMKKGSNKIDFEARNKKEGYDVSYQYVKSTKVVVDKVYKGNVKAGDELTFGQGGGADCIWTFGVASVGRKYLFYLGQPTKNHPYFDDLKMSKIPIYYAGECGRNQGVVDSYESDDLKYLNKIDQVKDKSRISGEFNCWWTGCPDSFANLKVKFIGENKTYETQTDKNGIYEIYDLPAGKYLINPEKPKGWKIDRFMLRYSPASRNGEYWFDNNQDFSEGLPVKLEEKKHTGIDFYFVVDTAIRGKVLSPEGKPMKGVCVAAVSTKLKEGDYRGQSGCTDENGFFIIWEIPANKYILVANNDGKLSEDEPFGTLFYPNTTKYSEAKSFEVKLGDRLDGFIIQVPKVEETVTISGKLLYSNDIPVANEYLKFDINKKEKNIDGEQTIKTDKEGNFSFKVLKGFAGSLLGKIYVYESKFENCPQLFAQIKKKLKGKDSGDLTTEKIIIDATKGVSNLVVKFDFQGCEKPKE